MTTPHIAARVRARVRAEAQHRCGYCLTTEHVIGEALEIDHLIPTARGGTNDEANLWLACAGCNSRKSSRVTAPDPVTGEELRLFNPRRDVWGDHFVWDDDGERITGTSPIGRATVLALGLNRPMLVTARRLWIALGLHPPHNR
jgi:hypothetical protein